MEEKRKFPRLSIKVLVNYSVSVDDPSASAETRNLSEGGICITTPVPLSVGRHVTIRFFLPGKTIRVMGRIIRSAEVFPRLFENGIEFIDITPDDILTIKDCTRGY
jgi:hypothetical protein